MKVLLVSSSGSQYVVQIWKYMKKYYPNISYSLLTNDSNIDFFSSRIKLEEGENIFYYHYDKLYVDLRRTINKLEQYDIIHFLWIERQMGLLSNLLKKKTKKIYTSVGGSDLYRESQRLHVRIWQKWLLNKSDIFSSENEATRSYFYKVYGEKYKCKPHSIVNFGVDIIDEIDNIKYNMIDDLKTKWGVPKDKIVVTLGYNGRREHQHIDMIKAISIIPENIIENFFFIIPMTYLVPSEEYVNEIIEEFDKVTSNYLILREYMTTKEMAETTVISDSMVHVQTTDQLSSTMVAHMYCGNVVIAGSWLPYSGIRNLGVEFYSVDNIGDISDYLIRLNDNHTGEKDICRANKGIIYRMSSWECVAEKWYNNYESLCTD